MTWNTKPFAVVPFVGPHETAYVDDGGDAYGEDASAFVECDAPGCGRTWDVVGHVDLEAKDAYLRTQGWSAVPATYAVPTEMRHLCLEHA